MPTLRELRVQALLSVNQLSKLAHIDRMTIERAERGDPVRDFKAMAIVQTLNQQLNTSYTLNQIDGLNIL